jgi:flagellar motor protein MotB
MAHKILAALSLVVLGSISAGCAVRNPQQKIDELTRECEELQRQKAEADAALLACKTRCDSAERRGVARPAAPAPAPFEVPADLQGKVDIRRRGNDTVIDIPSDVFFASGSSVLGRESERTMGQVADFMRRQHPNGLIRVEGHSDADPIRRTKSKYHCNWELSFDRAHAVMHYLVDKAGFDPRRVVCESYGEHHPVDSADKARNRRVEIVIADAR